MDLSNADATLSHEQRRAARCRLIVNPSNGLKLRGDERCGNESVSDIGLCARHLAAAHAEFEAVIAEHEASRR